MVSRCVGLGVLAALTLAGPAAAQQCKESIKGSQIPTHVYSDRSNAPGYYEPDSAVINDGDGHVVQGPASRAQVENLMGSGAFNGAKFSLVGGVGTGGGLPGGAFSCSYDGPRFKHGGATLQATVTVACNGSGVCP